MAASSSSDWSIEVASYPDGLTLEPGFSVVVARGEPLLVTITDGGAQDSVWIHSYVR